MCFVAACGGSQDAPPETTTPPSNEISIAVPDVTTAVLDAGSEPRAVVAPAPNGDEQNVTLVTESDVLQSIGAQPRQDFSSPQLTMPLTATADGTTIDMTLGRLTTPDGTLQAGLGPTENSAAGLDLTANGAVTTLRIDPAPDSTDIARSAVEQALNQAVYRAIAFPVEPIGTGARWTITQEIESGIPLRQITTVTLTDLTDSVATLDVSVAQSPIGDVWELPDQQGTLQIASFEMTGTGTLPIDLTRPLPVSGSITVAGEQVYRDANSETTLFQSTSNSVAWTS